MPSDRLPPDRTPNALALAVEALRSSGVPYVDLTESNPTRAGFVYPPALLSALSAAPALRYDPRPLGLPTARAAVARDFARRGADVAPDHVVLTASSSEAYSWLFKLLCDPGDRVAVPRPSYPLFDHLTRLESIGSDAYDLDYGRRWDIDMDSVERAINDRTRAVLVVSPNNPTGASVTRPEAARLLAICAERGVALIADEAFADYPLPPDPDERGHAGAAGGRATDLALQEQVVAFTLGGLSKTVGLPQVKLGWILVGGPPPARTAALEALEWIADSYLSVSTPVQVAAADLLQGGAVVRDQIRHRVQGNLRRLRGEAAGYPSCEVLAVEGGWYAPIRLPAIHPEETVAMDLLTREHILVHPGYFFDFPRESYVVVSLLPEPGIFADGVARMLGHVSS